jgi:hypothetical protein
MWYSIHNLDVSTVDNSCNGLKNNASVQVESLLPELLYWKIHTPPRLAVCL